MSATLGGLYMLAENACFPDELEPVLRNGKIYFIYLFFMNECQYQK